MSRIAPLGEKDAGLAARMAYGYAAKKVGRVPTPMAVAAHHPWVFRGYGAYEFAVERSNLVDKRVKTLAAIKASTLVGCSF